MSRTLPKLTPDVLDQVDHLIRVLKNFNWLSIRIIANFKWPWN